MRARDSKTAKPRRKKTATATGSAQVEEQLEQAGWSIGDVALRGEGGGLIWIVLGRCGSGLLMVSGATRHEAWRRALDQASAVGLLPGGAGAGERVGWGPALQCFRFKRRS